MAYDEKTEEDNKCYNVQMSREMLGMILIYQRMFHNYLHNRRPQRLNSDYSRDT